MSYRLEAVVEDYDVEGEGETWEEMLLAYAADCRAAADSCKQRADTLFKEAERMERIARQP